MQLVAQRDALVVLSAHVGANAIELGRNARLVDH